MIGIDVQTKEEKELEHVHKSWWLGHLRDARAPKCCELAFKPFGEIETFTCPECGRGWELHEDRMVCTK